MALTRLRFEKMLLSVLLLFALTLPLSKSAQNIFMFLGYVTAAAGMVTYREFRASVLASLRQPLMIAFSSYFLVALAGVFFTESYADGIHVANKFFSLPAIYLLVSVLIETIEDPLDRYRFAESALFCFLAGLMILNGIAIATYLGIVGGKKFLLPLTPLNVHHIWFSNINAIGLYGAVSLLLYSPRGKDKGVRAFLVSSLALAVSCIVLSLARTAWLGIAITTAVMALLTIRNRRVLAFSAAGAGVVCLLVYSFIPVIQERISEMISDLTLFAAGTAESSLGHRFMMWKAALMMFLSNPMVGVGTGGFVPSLTAYVKSGLFPETLLEYNQPHNMYFFALATNGLVGLVALLYLFYRVAVYSLPNIRVGGRERLFGFIALATAIHFMVAGCTDSLFNIQLLRYGFVFIMALCIRKSTIPAIH